MTSIIVDASIAAKWFLHEPDEEEALSLLDSDEELVAPDLLRAELGNIFWKRWRKGDVSSDAVLSFIDAFRDVPMRFLDAESLMVRAWSFAEQAQLSYYDSLYLAAAAAVQGTLITADRRLADAAARFDIAVRFLGSPASA